MLDSQLRSLPSLSNRKRVILSGSDNKKIRSRSPFGHRLSRNLDFEIPPCLSFSIQHGGFSSCYNGIFISVKCRYIEKINEMSSPEQKQTEQKPRVIDRLIENSGVIFHVCLGFTRNPWDAEDLTQEVYLKAMRNLKSLRNENKLKPWLLRIAKNICLNYIRKERFRRLFSSKNNEARSRITSPEWQLIYNEQYQLFKETLSRLSFKTRIVFILREYGQLSYQEIATTLGIKKGTVMSRLSRAREMINLHLKGEINEES